MKIRIIVVVLLGISELFAFARWFSCWLFQSNFYFTFQTLSTDLLINSNKEKGLPILLIRLLHNKLTGLIWGVVVTLLQYIDIRFLQEVLGIAGGIGIYLGFWYFAKKMPKNKILWFGVFLFILCSCTEIILVPNIGFSKRIIPLELLLCGFSFFGVWQFLQNGNKTIRVSLMMILILVSLLAIILFPHSLYTFCLKI